MSDYITPEQYLEIERAAEFKHEYCQGKMWPWGEPPMSTGTIEAHSLAVVNVIAELRQALRGGPCRIYTAAMRIRVDSGRFVCPDVSVVCGDPQFLDDKRDMLLNPSLIVGVDDWLNGSDYRSIESVTEYLLISLDSVDTHLYTRLSDGRWLVTFADRMEDSIELKSVGARLLLSDLYEKVEFIAP